MAVRMVEAIDALPVAAPPLFVVMIEFKEFFVLAWNIRGAASVSARRNFRDLLRVNHPTLLFLFETQVFFSVVQHFWTSEGYEAMHVEEVRGRSGEI